MELKNKNDVTRNKGIETHVNIGKMQRENISHYFISAQKSNAK